MVGHNVKDVFVQIILRFSFALNLLTSDEPERVPQMERRLVRKSYRLRQEEPLPILFPPHYHHFLVHQSAAARRRFFPSVEHGINILQPSIPSGLKVFRSRNGIYFPHSTA